MKIAVLIIIFVTALFIALNIFLHSGGRMSCADYYKANLAVPKDCKIFPFIK